MASYKGHNHLSKLRLRECMLCGTCDPPDVPLIYIFLYVASKAGYNYITQSMKQDKSKPIQNSDPQHQSPESG